MTKKTHVSKVASARFAAAVAVSLGQLVESGQVFNISDVIANARYDDGSKVGSTTIYAKTSGGRAVHGTLLTKVKAACARSRVKAEFAKSDAPSVELGSKAVVFKQLVEQESRLQEGEAAIRALTHQVRNAQERQYVALSCLSLLTTGTALDVVRPMRELEATFKDEELVARLREEGQELAATCGRLARSG